MPIEYSITKSTLHIELDRSAKRNAVDGEMAEQLEGALDLLEQREELRVAIISGAGGHFSAGTDLTLERSPATERGGEYGMVRRARSKPVIAAVEGIAFGGGFEIALSCDLIVAAATARFALPEAQRGVVPTCGGIFRVFDALPRAVAMGVLVAGEEIDGATAGRFGLVTRVADEGEAVAVAHRLAAAICRSAPASVAALLRAVRRAQTATTAAGWAATSEAIEAIDGGPDMREGIAAFFERRPPRWHPDTSPTDR
jgi:enoyl-CoA hydratase/carnithine racemase